MPGPHRRTRDGALTVAVIVATFAVQLPFRLHHVNLVDEGGILQVAVDLLAGRRLYTDVVHPAFPGVFWLVAAAFAVGGATFDTARTLGAVLFALTTGAVFRMARWWLGPLGALAFVVLFLDYRVWAYPHWHMISYSSLAAGLVLGATAVVGETFGRARRWGWAIGGVLAGCALVTKQDLGVLGTTALAAAILLVTPGTRAARVRAAAIFVAGVTLVFVLALAAVVRAGILDDLVLHAIVAPIHGLRSFEYQGSPSLWPLVTQDPVLREHFLSYFPSILIDVCLPAFVGSALYRSTAIPDLAVKVAFHLPWLLLLAAAPVVFGRASTAAAGDDVRRARERLVWLVAATFWLGFNRPHDWIHLLVLYPPTLLLGSLLLARAVRGRPRLRRVLGAAAVAGLVAGTALSVWLALGMRRSMDTPVRSTRGVIYASPPQAAALQELVDGLADAAPPGVPLAAFPYHPLVNFLSARPPLTRYYPIWPAEPDLGRTETVERDLDARPDGLVVYSPTQAPHFARMPDYAPELVAWLADHYRLERMLGGQPGGFEFLLARRAPEPAGRSLLGPALEAARVVVEPRGGTPRVATADERPRLVRDTVWPFRRVVAVTTEPDTSVAVRYPLTPVPGEHFRVSYGLNPDHWAHLPHLRVAFAVAVATPAGETPIADGTLQPLAVPADRRWVDVDVDLTPWAGQPIEIVLRTTGPPGVAPLDDRAGWGDPRIE
jgi:hypothetical protein